MATSMRLIWCQAGNPRSSLLAVQHGWWYGARSDGTIYPASTHGPLALLDVDWKKPDWQRHLRQAAHHRPWLATVPDTMSLAELDRTLRQAEAIAPYCEHPLIVPKCDGLIERLPRSIGSRQIVLGYSVPTAYGGTEVPLWEYRHWPVHLLGGNTRRQACLLTCLQVVSVDGNLAWRLARRGITMTRAGTAGQTLRQLDGRRWPEKEAYLEALRRSLVNLRTFWAGSVEWSRLVT